MLTKVWVEITHPFPSFNYVEAWEWIINHLLSMWLKSIHVCKKGPSYRVFLFQVIPLPPYHGLGSPYPFENYSDLSTVLLMIRRSYFKAISELHHTISRLWYHTRNLSSRNRVHLMNYGGGLHFVIFYRINRTVAPLPRKKLCRKRVIASQPR